MYKVNVYLDNELLVQCEIMKILKKNKIANRKKVALKINPLTNNKVIGKILGL